MKITNEDNMELMARYEDNYFDLAIVDPPYGIGKFTCEERTDVNGVRKKNKKNTKMITNGTKKYQTKIILRNYKE